jgi:hypothetical protein
MMPDGGILELIKKAPIQPATIARQHERDARMKRVEHFKGAQERSVVLARLDGADAQNEGFGQAVSSAHGGEVLLVDDGAERGRDAFRYDSNAFGVYPEQSDCIVFCVLGNDNNGIGALQESGKHMAEEHAIEWAVVLGQEQWYQVVQSEDSADAPKPGK